MPPTAPFIYHTFYAEFRGESAAEIVQALYQDSFDGTGETFPEWWTRHQKLLSKFASLPAADAPQAAEKLLEALLKVGALEAGAKPEKMSKPTRRSGLDEVLKQYAAIKSAGLLPEVPAYRAPPASITANTPLMNYVHEAGDLASGGFQQVRNGFTTIQNQALSTFGLDPNKHDPNLLMGTTFFGGLGFYAYKELTADTISIFDPRTRMANQLLMRGHASVDEILHSSYGEWPPKGLTLVGQNDQRVNFVPLLDLTKNDSKNFFERLKRISAELTTVAGRATLGGERNIGINRGFTTYLPGLLGQSSLTTTMGHEVVHSLQGDHYWRAREVFGQETASTIWGSQNNATSNLIASETFDQHTKSLRLYRGEYLREGIEIQARLHEVLSEGYQRWGVLPQNKEQLLVAMIDVGVKCPTNILRDLERSPTIEETRRIFSGKNPVPAGQSGDLNTAINTLTKEGKTEFWNKSLPALYSDLIEMYGDGPGRERFGLGTNPLPELRRLGEADKVRPVTDHPSTEKTFMKPPAAKPGAVVGEMVATHARVLGGVAGLATGAIMAATSGIATAAQPGASGKKITRSMIDSVIPGVMAAKDGDICKAAGQVAGTLASGAATAVTGIPAATLAVGATVASGPLAPVAGPVAAMGATAVTLGAGIAAYETTAPAAESACHGIIGLYTAAKEKFLSLQTQAAAPSARSGLTGPQR